MTDIAIKGRNISFRYPQTKKAFLNNIDLTVKQGECILICGASGSGKSTFSRLLNGVSPAYISGEFSGDLKVFDLKTGISEIEKYVTTVGSVFQNPKTQHFTTNSTDELAFPLENLGTPPSEIQELIDEVITDFQLEGLVNRNIFELSGGEKQQLAFAVANILKPHVLILDEVTSNLDAQAITRIRQMVQILLEKGVTIVIFEHRLNWTNGLVDRYLMFDEGEVKQEWTADEFTELSNQELNAFGLRSMDLSAHRENIQRKTYSKARDVKPKLQTSELAIGYSNECIQKNLSLDFYSGEIIGLMGANGRGKSTLANTLTGLQAPVSGDILWNGKKISSKQLLQKSYLVMQDINYQLFTESVEEEITLGAVHTENIEKTIECLNLSAYKERHPQSLSEGQKQRVAIASALVSGSELIIFDEPTSGLDFIHMARFGQLLQDLKKTDAIIIVITHDEELAANWCDWIIALE